MAIAKAPRYSSTWLELREAADAEARAVDLAEHVHRLLAGSGPLVIHDLGCGTGSMSRWLSPRLPEPQHWVLHDRDPDLLEIAAENLPDGGVPGWVSSEARLGDLTAITADDLAGASLVTASALLDILTLDEIDRLARACTTAGCPTFLTLSVVGHVDLSPWEPLDNVLCDAFNDHLRGGARPTGQRRPLGPAAADAAAEAFRRHGATVLVRETPWRLGAAHAELIADWLGGFVSAAAAQLPGFGADLDHAVDSYLARRLDQAAAGTLRVTVDHVDLLALPTPLNGPPFGGAAFDRRGLDQPRLDQPGLDRPAFGGSPSGSSGPAFGGPGFGGPAFGGTS
jgi:trans-aconitate methyltransferase